MKYLIILLVIIGLIVAGVLWVKSKIRSLFSGFNPSENQSENPQQREYEKDGDVLYNKDDVVVMKGDARNNEDDE